MAFEDSFKALLQTNSEITSRVTSLAGAPAIFCDIAPQTAEMPYIVFSIDIDNAADLVVLPFTIDVDIYHESMTAADLRELVWQIDKTINYKVILDNARYGTIRLYKSENTGYVDNTDISIKHYNMRIPARATDKQWIDEY